MQTATATIMPKQMCWLSATPETEKLLYLRENESQPWRPYFAWRQYAVPDYREPKGSKGWATYQRLRSLGWELVSTKRGEETVKELVGVKR